MTNGKDESCQVKIIQVLCFKGTSTHFRLLPGWWYIYIYIFVTAYDSKTHLTLSSMMGELSWRMSGIACWLAIHALAGRIKFVLIFNLKDCPKTMRKWYGNMFEVETSSKVVTCFSIIRVNQFLHPYVAFAVSIIRAFAYHFSIWNLFCFQKSKVQRWITRHLRFLLLMSGHPLVSDANYNPRGQARRHFVTWDDNEPSGGWWLYSEYVLHVFSKEYDWWTVQVNQLFIFKTRPFNRMVQEIVHDRHQHIWILRCIYFSWCSLFAVGIFFQIPFLF